MSSDADTYQPPEGAEQGRVQPTPPDARRRADHHGDAPLADAPEADAGDGDGPGGATGDDGPGSPHGDR